MRLMHGALVNTNTSPRLDAAKSRKFAILLSRGLMQTIEILKALDVQIAKLRQARAILAEVSIPKAEVLTTRRPGRPTGSINKPAKQTLSEAPVESPKRTMSPEGKARLVAALKARWAAKKKAERPVETGAGKSAAAVKKSPGRPRTRP